jgi:environmental stress-induced protein Ves
MPWANGKGITTELYVFPKEARITDGSAIWRVSMASVTENGPFSVLPDYERLITVAQGPGFLLTGNGVFEYVVSGGVFPFSGDKRINCEILEQGASCIDLNVFYKKGTKNPHLGLLQGPRPMHAVIETQKREILIVICLEGRATVRAYGKRETILLPPNDSAYFISNDGPGRLAVSTQAGSRVALVTVESF